MSRFTLKSGFLWAASGREDRVWGRHRTKSGRGRWVPLTPRLLAALRVHFTTDRFAAYGRKRRRTPWIFHHEVTHGHRRSGARIGSLRVSFKQAAGRAGLPPELHQHDLRHRRVSTWLAEGGNPVHVKEAMGHSDLRTTMGYTHLARKHLSSLVSTHTSPRSKAADVGA